MGPRSLILMATYNGEKFIRKQIESIIAQTYREWKLLIRDDGSKDETVSIINEYVEKDNRIELIKNDTSYHGAYSNFWALIRTARERQKYDFYFFSDQDDIWPHERMQSMINAAILDTADEPLLLYGDMQIIDGNDRLLHDSLDKIMGIGHMSGFTEFYSSGFVWGCNAMINRKLLFHVPIIPLDNPHINVMSHDNYFTKYALTIGKVKYLDIVCTQHRRYGSNTTGNYQLKLSPKSVIKRGIREYSTVAETHALGYVQTIQTIDMMKKYHQTTPAVLSVEKAIQKGGLSGVIIMLKQRVRRKQLSRTIGIYLIMFFGTYKRYMGNF